MDRCSHISRLSKALWGFLVMIVSLFPGKMLMAKAGPGMQLLRSHTEVVILADTHSQWEHPNQLPNLESKKWNLLSTHMAPDLDVGAYWLRFSLENHTSQEVKGILSISNWSEVVVFSRSDEGVFSRQQTGTDIPYAQRDFPLHAGLLIRTSLAKNESRPIWVRLKYIPNRGFPPTHFNLMFGKQEKVVQKQYTMAAINLAFIALLVFIFFYNLFLFLSTREKRFRFYLPSILLLALEILRESGFYGVLLGAQPWLPALEFQLIGLQNWLLCVLLPFLAQDFGNTRTNYPKWHKIILLMLAPPTLIYAISLFDYSLAIFLVFVTVIIAVVLTFSFNLLLIRKKHPLGFIFLFALLSVAVGTTLHATGHLGWWDRWGIDTTWTRSAGFVLGDVILSIILGRQTFNLRSESEKKQQQIIRSLEAQQELQNKMGREALTSAEQVRDTVARQLHEEVQSNLASVRLMIMTVTAEPHPAIGKVQELMKESIHKVRNISNDLMPATLADPMGLHPSLDNFLDRVAGPLEIDFSYPEPRPLPAPLRTLVYRVVQELVTNALKHAGAERMVITLKQDAISLILSVQDDGKGMTEEQFSSGKGLRNLRHNIELFGGKMEVKGGNGYGSEIRVELASF